MNDLGPGTGAREVLPGVVPCCMKADARDLLDRAIAGWEKHRENLPESLTVDGETWNPRESVYGFAYWLIRYSGLVAAAPENERSER